MASLVASDAEYERRSYDNCLKVGGRPYPERCIVCYSLCIAFPVAARTPKRPTPMDASTLAILLCICIGFGISFFFPAEID